MKTKEFSNDDLQVGAKFQAICIGPRGYEGKLTAGKEYQITISPRIMPLSPLCRFIGDNGKLCESHLHRFIQVVGEENG